MKHKHYDCIVAWAEGKKIEILSDSTGQWEDVIGVPYWVNNFQFRIKPESKPDVIKIFYLESNPLLGLRFSEEINPITEKTKRIRCMFDGETYMLKAVEMI